MGGGIHDGTEHWRTFDREGGFVTLNYRPLRTGERYCPACGADTLRREPDGTVYYVGHSEANCYRSQLSRARAEAERYRQQYETLRAAVEGVADLIRGAAEKARQLHFINRDPYDDGRSVGFGTAVTWLRKALTEHGEVDDDA